MTPLHQNSATSLPRVLLLEDDRDLSDAIASTLERGSDELTRSIPADYFRSETYRALYAAPSRPIVSHVTTAHTVADALALLDTRPLDSLPWDIVIVDLDFGHNDLHLSSHSGPDAGLKSGPDAGLKSGIDLLREIRGRGMPIGLILITGHASPEDFVAAIRCNVDDMLLKPLSLAALRESVTRCHSRLEESRSQIAQLRRFADDVIEMRTRLADSSQHSTRIESTVVEALLEALEVREPGSYMHSLRVQAYTVYFAHAIGYPESLLPQLERAAILHDIGKIGLTDSLLFKPETMSATEHERTQAHTLLGEQILSRIPFLRPSALIVRQHHEQFNGSGYPDGLSGESIPLGARLFSIIDSLDAITTDRPYRPALTFPQAIAEIQTCAGTQFDPHLVDQFARIPAQTWADLRLKVEQRRLTRIPTQPGQIPQLTART